MTVEQLVKHYLQDAKMMHLATVADGKPWVCNVWFAADEDFNIYWFSSVTRRHSQEVAKDSHVAGSMCLANDPAKNGDWGMQFEGVAEMLTDEADIAKAKSVYMGRIFTEERVKELMGHAERPHKFYRIKPELFVIFDGVNFPDNPRQEWRPNA
ncbi:MAG TPA: pyridoxamine 5'-phosphate oxidase family protein [Candidatus Saccharimonadales bacterium]|nr:pyridoxamine 5'-phosphate oxidase family protein [Candidatus Saccharimonadales bacterium]